MLALSASKIDCYYNCPKLYYFKYVGTPKQIEDNKYFAVGNIAHKILENYHKKLLINVFDIKKTVVEVLEQLKNDKYLRKQLNNNIIGRSEINEIGNMLKGYIAFYKHTANEQIIEKDNAINQMGARRSEWL